jgi:hypothetical protein
MLEPKRDHQVLLTAPNTTDTVQTPLPEPVPTVSCRPAHGSGADPQRISDPLTGHRDTAPAGPSAGIAPAGKASSCRMLFLPTQMSSSLPNRRKTLSCR